MKTTTTHSEEYQDIKNSKKFSRGLRIWHWSNLVVIAGSLVTVLLNSTVTEYTRIGALIQTGLAEKQTEVGNVIVLFIAHKITDSIWYVHVYFGYALTGLLLFRLILEFFEIAENRFLNKIKSAYVNYKRIKKNRETALHEMTVKLIYAVFYLLLLTMVLTGLFVGYGTPFYFYKAVVPTVLKIHGTGMYLILIFIIVHLLGVFFSEIKESKGIVSDMINGGKTRN